MGEVRKCPLWPNAAKCLSCVWDPTSKTGLVQRFQTCFIDSSKITMECSVKKPIPRFHPQMCLLPKGFRTLDQWSPRMKKTWQSSWFGLFKNFCVGVTCLFNNVQRDLPGSPVVKTSPSNAGAASSIPGWGAKIPQASEPKNQNTGNSLAVQWLRLHLPMQWMQVRSLVRELRFHMPLGQKTKA